MAQCGCCLHARVKSATRGRSWKCAIFKTWSPNGSKWEILFESFGENFSDKFMELINY